MDVVKIIYMRLKRYLAVQDRKKLLENAAIVAIIGIIAIIAGSMLFSGDAAGDENKEKADGGKEAVIPAAAAYRRDRTEERLKSILSQVQGVGKVDVMITYETSVENVPAYDTKKSVSSTEEKDSNGGTRNITEEENESSLAYEDSDSGEGKKPVILKELEPEVRGVLVVAEGADSIVVRERICSAVSVVLDIPPHKVQVAQRKK